MKLICEVLGITNQYYNTISQLLPSRMVEQRTDVTRLFPCFVLFWFFFLFAVYGMQKNNAPTNVGILW